MQIEMNNNDFIFMYENRKQIQKTLKTYSKIVEWIAEIIKSTESDCRRAQLNPKF